MLPAKKGTLLTYMSDVSMAGPDTTEDRPDGPANKLHKADLHMHTNLGDGTASPRQVLQEAKRRNLRVIAVTDHDHMEGAKRVAEIIDREGGDIEMIWGCEVTAREGHFLGLFMKRPVKFLMHVEGVIDAIKEQGGLCIIPHPMGWLVPSLSRKKIEELLQPRLSHRRHRALQSFSGQRIGAGSRA